MEKLYDLVETETKLSSEEVASDFDLKIERERGVLPEKKLIKRSEEDVSVDCIVLLEDFPAFNAKEGSYNLEILGKKMYEYVVRACPSVPICVHFDSEKQTAIKAIKPHLRDGEYTLVLYADTPLITKATLLNILDFVKSKGLNACPLERGYVFKTEYIKRVDAIYSPSVYNFQADGFMSVNCFEKLYFVLETLKSTIINYHSKHGVYFKNPATVYIEPDVSIMRGAVIEGNVRLEGDTRVSERAYISAGSVIIDSTVGKDARVYGAYLSGAFVLSGAVIKSGAKLLSKTAIKENSIVGENCVIKNAIIGASAKIEPLCYIDYLNADEGVEIKAGVVISSSAKSPVKMGRGAKVKEKCVIAYGAKIEENEVLEPCTVLVKSEADNG